MYNNTLTIKVFLENQHFMFIVHGKETGDIKETPEIDF